MTKKNSTLFILCVGTWRFLSQRVSNVFPYHDVIKQIYWALTIWQTWSPLIGINPISFKVRWIFKILGTLLSVRSLEFHTKIYNKLPFQVVTWIRTNVGPLLYRINVFGQIPHGSDIQVVKVKLARILLSEQTFQHNICIFTKLKLAYKLNKSSANF